LSVSVAATGVLEPYTVTYETPSKVGS